MATAHTTKLMNARLTLLNKLRNRQYPLITFMTLPSTRHAQILASTGLDGIIVDCEHGHISDDAMHNSVAAISSLSVSPIVRVRGATHDILKRALDTGAHGVLVPQVNNAEEAAQIVQSCKFPPRGIRGQGSPFSALGHGLTMPEYLASANETILTMVQIETRAAVENVDAIAAVAGVDVLFIGPNDLALALLGYLPARGDEPKFVAAVEKTVVAARKHGKWVARLVESGALAEHAKGTFDMVAIANDVKAMQRWFAAELGAVRR